MPNGIGVGLKQWKAYVEVSYTS